MKTLHLNIDDKLYGTLLAMLKGLPAKQIEIVEDLSVVNENICVDDKFDINDYAGKISSFDAIKDPVAWQKKIRAEWDS